MVQAIGSSALAAYPSGGGVDLQARLERCNRQLASWESCASAKTPEGQKIIAQLAAQASSIKTQIDRQAQSVQTTPTAPTAPSATTSLGSQVNVYA